MKKKKVLIILAVLILGVTTFFVVKRYLGNKAAATDGDTSGSGSTPSSSTPNSKAFPLKKGSQGAEVRHLQRWLNASGPYPPYQNLDSQLQPHNAINVDGIFGIKTEAALKTATGGIYSYVTKAYYDMKNMQNF